MADSIEVVTKRFLIEPDRPPVLANRFGYARYNSSVVLEVGFVDLLELHEKINQTPSHNKKREVVHHVTNRFVLSPEAVKELHDMTSRILVDLATPTVQAEPETKAIQKAQQ